MIARLAAAALLFVIVVAAPAVAATTGKAISIPIPEPADMVLFAAGVIGLLVGRRTSRNRRRREDQVERDA